MKRISVVIESVIIEDIELTVEGVFVIKEIVKITLSDRDYVEKCRR